MLSLMYLKVFVWLEIEVYTWHSSSDVGYNI